MLTYNIIQVNAKKLKDLYDNRPENYSDYKTKVNSVFELKRSHQAFPDFTIKIKNNEGKEVEEVIKQNVKEQIPSDFYIMLLPMEVLCDYLFYVVLANSKYRKFKELYKPKPIIFISAFNIYKDFYRKIVKNNKEVKLLEEEHFKEQEKDLAERVKYFNTDKRKGFLDNSVWHFYVPFQNYSFYNNKNDNDVYVQVEFKTRLAQAISVIYETKDLELYDALAAKENLEFQVRLMKNSYLDDIGGDHSKHITPFIFHSETEMRHRANNVIKQLLKKYDLEKEDEIKWNVLLLDDFGEKNLKPIDKNKKQIVEEIVKKIKEVSNKTLKIDIKVITFKQGENILEKFLEDIKTDQYDIILLDYLLNNEGDSDNRILGSELFTNPSYKKIIKNTDKGVLGKYWFLPISAFNDAMLDRIVNEGVSRVTEDWYLFDGADPISTPELFKYNLVKLMELQLNQTIVAKEEIINDLLNSGFMEEDINVGLQAKGMYGSFMHKFGIKEYLKLDEKNNSAFAVSVLEYLNEHYKEEQEFYEHIRKLLFLVGNGTQNDTRKINNLLEKIESLLPDKYKLEESQAIIIASKKYKINSFFKNIVDYINKLIK